MMTTTAEITTPDYVIENCLKLWRDKILSNHKRKDLTSSDLATLFQQKDLQKAFFSLIDRDYNGSISFEEWTGCFSKLYDESNDAHLLNWFVDKFYAYCNSNDTVYINEKDFESIVSDIEFGYRLASLISPKSRHIKSIQLITSLEIIASLSTDAKWLSWLKYQFTEAINKDNREHLHVTLNDFLQNFNFKEPFLAERLFTYLDVNKSGYLSLREFINGLEVVVNGSQEEKMEFLFKVFDVDGNGRIDIDELKMMLKCCLDDSPSLDSTETVDDLSVLLFTHLDKDDSGDISIDELKSAFRQHYDLFKSLSISTSIWIKPKFVTKKIKEESIMNRVKHFFQNKRATLIFWSIYILIHLVCMICAYLQYMNQNVLVIIARMFGNSLNFNCALILVLVLRKHLTWLRIKGGNSFLPIDDFISIHKIIGIVILIETLIHTIAHLINLYNIATNSEINYWEALFTFKVNIGFPTGVYELILLVIILVFASSYLRNKGYFQLFFMVHLLTIPWLLIMLSHGKNFWKWLLLPAFCYIIEKILRYHKIRSNKFGDTFIIESYVLPSKVTHLVIRKPSKFYFKPGDYIYINIPIIAKYEWHPFSISSAPEDSDLIWLHIKGAGNWTNKLYSYSQTAKFDNLNMSNALSASQRSILRLNMRAKMSNLLNNSLSNNDEPIVNFNMKKVVSFVPESNLIKNEQQIDLSKISNNKDVIFYNDETEVQTPICNEMSIVPQSFKDKYPGQLKHKSILKVLSLNANSPNLKQDQPTESTPRYLNNLNKEINKSDQFRNRSKSLDDEVSLFDSQENHLVKSGSINQLSDKYKTRLNYFNNENTSIVPNDDTNHFSKNNLVLSYENNLSVVVADNKAKNEGEDACFLNMTESSNESNVKDKSITSLYNRVKQQIVQIAPKSDVLGYLKMYTKPNRVNMNTIGLDDAWRLKIHIDGPYGTPSNQIFYSEHAVLIAAGIGITPFASILQSIMHKFRQLKAKCPNCEHKLNDDLVYQSRDKLTIKKVDFIWITRDQRSLEWFISLLSQMEIEQKKNNELFLETHLYVTSAKRQSDLRSIGLQFTLDAIFSQEESCLINDLRKRTHHGRPNWDIVLQNLIRKQKGKIDVFYCGLPSLATVLQGKCKEYDLNFKKEIF